MQIRYIFPIAVDLGGAVGHTEPGRVVEVPDAQGRRLLALGHAEAVTDPVEPVRHAPTPTRRTR